MNNSKTLKRFNNPLYEEDTELSPPGPKLLADHGQEAGPTYEVIPPPAKSNKKGSKKNGNIYSEANMGKLHSTVYTQYIVTQL